MFWVLHFPFDKLPVLYFLGDRASLRDSVVMSPMCFHSIQVFWGGNGHRYVDIIPYQAPQLPLWTPLQRSRPSLTRDFRSGSVTYPCDSHVCRTNAINFPFLEKLGQIVRWMEQWLALRPIYTERQCQRCDNADASDQFRVATHFRTTCLMY